MNNQKMGTAPPWLAKIIRRSMDLERDANEAFAAHGSRFRCEVRLVDTKHPANRKDACHGHR